MNFLKTILTIMSITKILEACSVIQGYPFATIPEQVDKAGAVFKGTVVSVTASYPQSVILKNIVYYKGCGPSTAKVSSFRSSATCGVDAPSVGTNIIIFACYDNNSWVLNEIAVFAGATQASKKNIAQIESLTENELHCANCCFMYKNCKKRV